MTDGQAPKARKPKVKQQALFDKSKVTSAQFHPDKAVQDAARSYAQGEGLQFKTPNNQQQVDPVRGYAQALAYKEAQAAPREAPGIRESYGAMREHVNKQYDYLTRPSEKGGMGFTHGVTPSDPYPSVQHAARDIAQRKIKTFSTETTGGHEFFTNEENDKFRAVHDVFGHASTGRGFSRHGEEAAFLAHRSMFPPEAHAALTSETRGQNSYLNFGGTNSFPDQGPGSKLVGLPGFASSTAKFKVTTPKSARGRGRQLRLF